MKNLSLGLLGLLSMFVWTGVAVAQISMGPAPHFYGLEHAVIEYEISGAVKGKETLYFDQWGMRQARHKTAETQRWGTVSTTTLNVDGRLINFDLNKNLGQKKEDPLIKQLLAQFTPEDTKLLSVGALELAGGKKIKNETLLERSCEVWETDTPKMRAWVWEGILLKTQEDTPEGPVVFTAVSMDLITPVDKNLFLVPDGVQFIDRDINEILIN